MCRFGSIRSAEIRGSILPRVKARSQSHHWEDQMALVSKYSEDLTGRFFCFAYPVPAQQTYLIQGSPLFPSQQQQPDGIASHRSKTLYHLVTSKAHQLVHFFSCVLHHVYAKFLVFHSSPSATTKTANDSTDLGHQSNLSTFLLGLKLLISFPSSSLSKLSESPRSESPNARTQAPFSLLHFRQSEIRAVFSIEVIGLASG